MQPNLEVILSPTEYEAFEPGQLAQTTCVVFDILRATTSMMTAFAHGAAAIIPVSEISEAVALKQRNPSYLLGGERHGLKITAAQTGLMDFDFGNSPREFLADRVGGKTIAMTTTNGTRALRACLPARQVLIGSFLNLAALARALKHVEKVCLVCSGTGDYSSFEDTLAAGALADLLWNNPMLVIKSDSAAIAREVYLRHADDLIGAMQHASNGRRLLLLPELAADVPFCLQRDTLQFTAALSKDGTVRQLPPDQQ